MRKYRGLGWGMPRKDDQPVKKLRPDVPTKDGRTSQLFRNVRYRLGQRSRHRGTYRVPSRDVPRNNAVATQAPPLRRSNPLAVLPVVLLVPDPEHSHRQGHHLPSRRRSRRATRCSENHVLPRSAAPCTCSSTFLTRSARNISQSAAKFGELQCLFFLIRKHVPGPIGPQVTRGRGR